MALEALAIIWWASAREVRRKGFIGMSASLLCCCCRSSFAVWRSLLTGCPPPSGKGGMISGISIPPLATRELGRQQFLSLPDSLDGDLTSDQSEVTSPTTGRSPQSCRCRLHER